MNIRTIAFSILVVVILAGNALMGEVPHCINYQGYLADASGVAVADGIYNINFSIYGSPSGTDLLWNSGTRAVQVTDGIFSYMLGSNTSFPADLFVGDTARYLGITVGADPEMTPRTKLMSSTYSQHAAIADNLVMPATFDGDGHFTGDLTVDGNLNVPGGLGDITGVTAGSGLSGGGSSGNVSIYVPDEGIASDHIKNSSIVDEDISASADIAPTKIDGTAAVWGADNFFNSVNHFYSVFALHDHGPLFIRDAYARWGIEEPDSSGMIFRQYYNDENVYQNRIVLEIGDDGTVGIGGINETCKLNIYWDPNTSSMCKGVNSVIRNDGTGVVYAGNFVGQHSGSGSSSCYGLYGGAYSDVNTRIAIKALGQADNTAITTGSTYGLYASSYDGDIAYGIYGRASSATTNWAGYFSGNCRVTGTFDNSKSTMRIDHPSDPENKVLMHATMNSPEMLNVYTGNITIDANGKAIVQLPDYFEALNRDFRYQLTCIGGYAQVYIAEEISNNQFTIAGGKPGMKISWQVTGVRKDAFAEANPVIVEKEKTEKEKGYYINPEAFGLDETRSTEYATNPEFKKEIDERREGANESE
jgi:hypothetical protein